MKKLIILIQLLYIGIASLNGQASSIMSDSVMYITPEDEVHLRDREAKYLIKLGSDVSVEVKFFKAWSLELEIGPDNYGVNQPDFSLGLGARYYYQMAKRIQEGKQANNFSGRYFSAMLSRGFNFGDPQFDPVDNASVLTLGMGTQQRYLQREYFDFGIFLDLSDVGVNGSSVSNSFTLRTESNYGFVFGKKHELNKEKFCPVIKCYQDRKSAIKINRNDFLLLSMDQLGGNTFWFLRMRPRIGYEFKLGNSAFSVDQTIGANLSFSNYLFEQGSPIQFSSFNLQRTVLTYDIAARYYYLMRKKVLAGIQGNNLTGWYTYLRFRHEEIHTRFSSNWNRVGTALVGFGRQKNITGRLFLDFKFAIGPELYDSANAEGISPFGIGSISSKMAAEVDFVIGYMF